MMTSRPPSLARLFLAGLLLAAATTPALHALQTAGAAETPAVAAAREAYRKASEDQAAARDELDRLVHALEPDYLALTRGARAASLKHALVTALHDGLQAASARYAAREAQSGRRPARGTRREILLEVLGEPALGATSLDPQLVTFVTRRVADELSISADVQDVTPERLLGLIEGLFLPGETWPAFWNRSFREDLDAAKRFITTNEKVQETWLALDQARSPERYGPRGEPVPAGMVVVPGGTYRLGPNSGQQREQRSVTLAAFALDRREVTQREYAAFIAAQPAAARAALLPRGWRLDAEGRPIFDETRRDHPVVYVSWVQAQAFATWHGKRLPTEDEWEAAAAGLEGRAFPWGDEFRQGAANGAWGPGSTLPVESFPQFPSAARCFDMGGNVWEWTSTTADGVNVTSLPQGYVSMIIRGGGFDSRREELSSRYRWAALAEGTFGLPTYTRPIGFRCAKSLK